jgi:hypothetical protein
MPPLLEVATFVLLVAGLFILYLSLRWMNHVARFLVLPGHPHGTVWMLGWPWRWYPQHGEIALWSKDHATSSAQVQKLYDWHIAQWSGSGTVVLTATVGFISAVTLETLKTPTIWDKRGTAGLVAIGLTSSTVLYLLIQLRIQRLREVFRDLYSLMCNLKP